MSQTIHGKISDTVIANGLSTSDYLAIRVSSQQGFTLVTDNVTLSFDLSKNEMVKLIEQLKTAVKS